MNQFVIFAMPFATATLLRRWYPVSLATRLASGLRTLAVGSVVVTAVASLIAGGDSAGVLIRMAWMQTDFALMLQGVVIIVLMALAFDLLAGIVQYALYVPAMARAAECPDEEGRASES